MFSLIKPKSTTIREIVSQQSTCEFTYAAVGATAATPPSGFVVDHTRCHLGEGEATFLAAKAALMEWKQFQLGWIEPWSTDTPIEVGAVVAVLARVLGIWSVNVCRIAYTINDVEPIIRFGFAYGTLPHHVECGEERFEIQWNRSDNQVWYDILAFSRPAHVLTRIGYPIVRRIQKRFGRDSTASMMRAVRRTNHTG